MKRNKKRRESKPKPVLKVPAPFEGLSDTDKLVWMLSVIRQILDDMVHLSGPPLIPVAQGEAFINAWPEVDRSIAGAIHKLNTKSDELALQLQQVGMANQMLNLKAKTLQLCVDGLYQEVNTTGPLLRPLFKFLKPATKCMNSVLGSLSFLGLEIPKEFKDHFEVALDLAAASK